MNYGALGRLRLHREFAPDEANAFAHAEQAEAVAVGRGLFESVAVIHHPQSNLAAACG